MRLLLWAVVTSGDAHSLAEPAVTSTSSTRLYTSLAVVRCCSSLAGEEGGGVEKVRVEFAVGGEGQTIVSEVQCTLRQVRDI